MDRVRLQRAIETLLALQSQGNVLLSKDWIDALARFPTQIDYLDDMVNVSRAHAKAMSRPRRR